MNTFSFSLFFLTFFGLLNIVNAYYLPNSYQRYMDENQAVLRNLLAEVEQQAPKEQQQQQFHKIDNEEIKMPSAHVSHPDSKVAAASATDNLVPRRDQRQFFFAPQYKRMRPCFYSPIQCLMKRSEVLDA
uniref:Uncharacterized protein n=2 Tax=Panagrolaimus sp. PS1159 TaxID=55785 RepID=A0AC35FAE6_9BILA